MKICPICKVNPSLNQIKGGYCRPCNCDYGKRNYQANKERYYQLAHKRQNDLRELINKVKSKPCIECGQQFHPVCMDLDHRDPTQKVAEVSYMLRHRWAVSKIVAEIEKCDVLCANCHRLKSYREVERINAKEF